LPGTLPPILIQETALEYRQFERVEITGSSIVNPKSRDVLPVRVIDAREIERSGVRSTAELIQSLPMMNSVNELGGVNTSGLGGYQSGAIHGYEAGTLVLINGRRNPSFARQRADQDRTAVDLSFVPLRAIERIEILTDGASSLYGSDAIAGVINIITKQDAPGLTVSGERLASAGRGGDGQTMGISWGAGKLKKEGFAVQMHLEMTDRSGVLLRDREYSDPRTRFFGNDANGRPVYFSPLNTFEHALPGKIQRSNETAENCPEDFEFAVTLVPGVSKCQNSKSRRTNLYPDYKAQNFHGQFELALNRNHALFGEIGHSNQDTQFARFVNGRTSVNLNGQTILFDGEELSPGFRRDRQTNQRLVTGARGNWQDWDYTLALSHGQNKFTLGETGGLTSNLWGRLLTQSELLQNPSDYSAATWNKISTVVSPDRQVREASTQLTDINLTASRKIGETDWGDIKLGTVLFVQRQKFESNLLVPSTIEQSYDAKRGIGGGALEIQAPAFENLLLTGSLRADKYSDFGVAATGKAGFKYTVSRKTFIRGSIGSGFRAPTLTQINQLPARIGISANSHEVYAQGNPDLQPEKSQQMSLGFQRQANSKLAYGADLWQLNVRDVFGAWSVDQIKNDPMLKQKYFIDNLTGLDRYNIAPLNLGQMLKRGIDYNIRFRHPMNNGRLWLNIEGTHNLKSDQSPYPGQDMVSDIGVYRNSTNTFTPKDKVRFSSIWETAKYQMGASINYTSGNLENIPNVALLDSTGVRVGRQYMNTVPAQWTLDVSGIYQINSSTKFRLGIQNLTNETPPLRFSSLYAAGASQLTDTRYNNYYGRTVRISIDHRFY
jgi:iron complex outermembrane receptor protein